jgi:hypothetical protein
MVVQEMNVGERPARIQSENEGGVLSTSFTPSKEQDPEGYDATEYGRRFMAIRLRNFPPILVV